MTIKIKPDDVELAFEKARWIVKFIRRKSIEKQKTILEEKKQEWGSMIYNLALEMEPYLNSIREIGHKLSLYKSGTPEHNKYAREILKIIDR